MRTRGSAPDLGSGTQVLLMVEKFDSFRGYKWWLSLLQRQFSGLPLGPLQEANETQIASRGNPGPSDRINNHAIQQLSPPHRFTTLTKPGEMSQWGPHNSNNSGTSPKAQEENFRVHPSRVNSVRRTHPETKYYYRGRGRATKQDGRLERELRAEAVPEGRRGREDSRTTHRVRCPSTLTTAGTRNHVRGPRRSGTQGRKLATRPRPIRPYKRGGVASSEDRGRRARSGKEQAEQAAGTAGAVTTRIHLPTTPTNTRGPSTPHRETGRRSKGVRPLRQPG
ncbi:hypothetical protein NDU88_000193 [Pleurodeles waltl]|uniref:Uncharacterized protein n=1 Tax=Pleurodeles waltl TaxID=8319 RepID=A0AAV7UQY0_PLEWA|nr:hypothetical protein NDU88_000193 [Pleurodeles waltl]